MPEPPPGLPPDVPPGPPPGGRTKRARIPWYAIVVLVVGLALIAGAIYQFGSNGDGEGAHPSVTVSPSVSTVAGPTALKAKPSAFKVTLSWKSTDGDAPTNFRIFRNGDLIGEVNGADHSYVDTGAVPLTKYTYAVEGQDQQGGLSSKAVVRTKTPEGPLTLARLQGVFNMRLHITSQSGVSGIDSSITQGWRFTPKCASGACDTTFKDIHWAQMQTDLKQAGVQYTGDFTVHGYLTCQGTDVASSMHVNVHVTDARSLHEQWRATKVEGTVTLSNGSQLGCSSASITYSVAGALPS